MDPKYSAEVLKHLENQSEMLTQVQRSMSHELHKLQVEEEMLMRKLYEIMTVHGYAKKSQNKKDESNDGKVDQ
ncbi:uncharacterized protein LOC116201375 [Punica granatum]|uniref:Uncharacterized protein LOC116201375 n=2 Tax=Punica granatum TaxID=22663 RepID=A0A6P8D4J6_PUNGR|nr:uncharacterized protein LOC116201375 [Punica granatum]PKI71302.1 hypothetical protein CRG98_008302 [Punica granatum]